MKFGVIIPTRGDRPRFLANCLRQLKHQTIQPDEIALMDYEPESDEKDITQRYRRGYDQLRGKNLDVIFFAEDDEFYSTTYFETMLGAWIDHGKPKLFGLNETIYYHIKLFAYFKFGHDDRSSAMSTMIVPDLDFPWCLDSEPFTDMYLWYTLRSTLQGVIWRNPPQYICIGMKHGVGLTGGDSHTSRLDRYRSHRGINDTDHSFLKEHLDPISLDFFVNYFAVPK